MENKIPPLVGFSSFAEAGFPTMIWPVVFVPWCNFRCPYCLNAEIVTNESNIKVTLEQIQAHIDKSADDRILISGGEPTMHHNLGNLIRELQEMDLKVGISTNGSNPERLQDLINNYSLYYVAMDIKCGLNNVEKLSSIINPNHNAAKLITKIRESIAFLNSTIGRTEFSFEFRTTLYPPLVQEQDIIDITKEISPKSVYYLQQFRARKGLLGGDEIANIEPYDDVKLEQLITIARERVPNTQLRYI